MRHEQHPPPQESLQVFETYAKASELRLSQDTIATYRFVWNQWASWLAGEQLAWHSANERAVSQFLISLRPRGHGARAVSDVTKRRYWRILKDVYAAAAAADGGERLQAMFPRPWDVGASQPETNAKSMIFRGRDMATLRATLDAEVGALWRLVSGGHAPPWVELRDAALLAVLMSTGAKVAELRNLFDDNLRDHKPEGATSEPGEIRYVVLRSGRTLRTSENKSVPSRSLELDSTARRALRLWIDYRQQAGLREQHAPLFVRAANRSGPSPKDPLSAVSVFHTVARFVGRAFPQEGNTFQHVGPESLRNSVIRAWMDSGLPEEQILANAGVRDTKLLRRLEGSKG